MVETKECFKCKEVKKAEEFTKDRAKKTGLSSYCKDCRTEYRKEYYVGRGQVIRDYQNKYNKKDKAKYGAYLRGMKRRHSMNEQEFRDMQDEQKGMCAICGSSLINPSFHQGDCSIDHNHETEERRGLLCQACNTAFGLLEEDRDRIISMINYLDKWEQ